jgi:hypothetical protein
MIVHGGFTVVGQSAMASGQSAALTCEDILAGLFLIIFALLGIACYVVVCSSMLRMCQVGKTHYNVLNKVGSFFRILSVFDFFSVKPSPTFSSFSRQSISLFLLCKDAIQNHFLGIPLIRVH